MSQSKPVLLLTACACALLLVAVPPRYGFGMSKLKSWVNTVRPGTFPEIGAANKNEQQPPALQPKPQEALTESERQILLSLTQRKRQLDERDAQLNQREEQLRLLRDNIQHQVVELKRLQSDIEASMEAKKAQDAENLKKVVTLYNGMDPAKAATQLQTLEPKVAVQILMAMNQRKASAVMQALSPDQAKKITEEIVRKAPAGS